MKDIKSFDVIMQAVDRLHGLVEPAQVDVAIYIVKELQKRILPKELDVNKLWAECEALSNQLYVVVPFYSKQTLGSAYNFLTDEIDYEIP